MIQEGKYVAKAISGRLIKSPTKGTPGVAVLFEFKDGATSHQLTWYGWLTENTLDRTFETLATIGLDESVGNTEDGQFKMGAFSKANDVEIVIEMEAYEDRTTGEQKSTPKIKWVNKLGGSKFGEADSVAVKDILSKYNFKKEMTVARQKLGVNKVKNEAPTFDASEEVPF